MRVCVCVCVCVSVHVFVQVHSSSSFFFFFGFCLFRAALAAYGGSQARGPNGAVVTGL